MLDYTHVQINYPAKLHGLGFYLIDMDGLITLKESPKPLQENRNSCQKDAKGCYVNTVCVDGDLIQSYIQYQEKEKREEKQLAGLFFRVKE